MAGKKIRKGVVALLETIKSKLIVALTGLTLTELIVIIVILGILVALTLPQFRLPRERAFVREAIANLKLIAAAEKIYRLEVAVYYPGDSSIQSLPNDINSFLKLDLTEANWDYVITGDVDTFTATADRQTGAYADCVYRIDEITDEPCTDAPANCPPGATLCN